ncbi:MAG: flagellar biosynthetic protein FliO [Succinivibrionaceae bacterium]|nr:flagellar biosynthetic protein FliO [Succinivibrionaceae bacterium]
MKQIIYLAVVLFPGIAAAVNESSAQKVGLGAPGASISIVQWMLSCIGVIFLMFMLAYFLKKAKFIPGLRNGVLKVVAMIAVGSHEKMAIVRAGKSYYLVGITPQKITKLAEIAPGEIEDEPASGQNSAENGKGNFAEKLFAFMNKGRNSSENQTTNAGQSENQTDGNNDEKNT